MFLFAMKTCPGSSTRHRIDAYIWFFCAQTHQPAVGTSNMLVYEFEKRIEISVSEEGNNLNAKKTGSALESGQIDSDIFYLFP